MLQQPNTVSSIEYQEGIRSGLLDGHINIIIKGSQARYGFFNSGLQQLDGLMDVVIEALGGARASV